ncbi:MAG TPA: GAF domain-containing SpoIIE family protein phosphatase [Gemmatimonadales bacterium]
MNLRVAAERIVREVSAVVGARRASLMVYDERAHELRNVAAEGFSAGDMPPVAVDDPRSVAARVFREQCVIVHDPEAIAADGISPFPDRVYRGGPFLSVPIRYAAPGSAPRCVGVLSFTERDNGAPFTDADRRLVTAIANLVAVAIENARLVARERKQQRLRRELELAADLQLRLLPSPAVLHGDADVAARCVPAEWVGGDFYTFSRLGHRRIGVMLGDISSHGFSAALVMALVLSAAGIHSGAASAPDETLAALLESLSAELVRTEMYLSVFYGVLDPASGRLIYANAGHPHAFRIGDDGATRLDATAPPLGLATADSIRRQAVEWRDGDLLCLWTDGLVDARASKGEAFGEERLLASLLARRHEAPEAIVAGTMADVDAFAAPGGDDRTLLALRLR